MHGIWDGKRTYELFTKKATEKLMELDAPRLTVEDIAVIFCYTFEWDKERFGEVDSPYKRLNNSLSVDRSNAALKKTRGFLFLLFQALRKLPRFVPENHALYIGLRAHVQTKPDPVCNKCLIVCDVSNCFTCDFCSSCFICEPSSECVPCS